MLVWIAACLVIRVSVIAVVMAGNNCKYHFDDEAAQTFGMLACNVSSPFIKYLKAILVKVVLVKVQVSQQENVIFVLLLS